MRPQRLGVGIVWWPELDPLVRAAEGLIDFVEAEPEAFWRPSTDPGRSCDRFRSDLDTALGHIAQPKLLHGVGAPLGGTCPPPAGHTATFAHDIELLDPAWVSEHLSFSSVRSLAASEMDSGSGTGFLLPPAHSRRGVMLAAETIRKRRAAYGGGPFAFETGVNYLPTRPGDMADGEFAGAVADMADCGILLDLHNLLCNERNGRQTVAAFCEALPLDRVWEMHLAGGDDLDGFCLDAHSGLIAPALMELAGDVAARLPNLGAITFEIMPDAVASVGLAAIGRQLGQLKDLWASVPQGHRQRATATNRLRSSPIDMHSAAGMDPAEWEQLLGNAIRGQRRPQSHAHDPSWWGSALPALSLYRRLAEEARGGTLTVVAPRTLHLLLCREGSAGLRGLLAQFWADHPPCYTALDEGQRFLDFVVRARPEADGMDEAIGLDRSDLRRLLED